MAAIMHHLERWEQKYPTFIQRNAETYQTLLRSFDLLSFKIIRAAKSMVKIDNAIMRDVDCKSDDWNRLDALAKSANTEPSFRLQSASQAAVGTMMEDLRKDIDLFLDFVLLFVARGVLSNEWSSFRRQRELAILGFTIGQGAPSVAAPVFGAVAILIPCSIIWFTAIATDSGAILMLKAITISSLNVAMNFVIVYYLKRKFAFANEGIFGGIPLVFILSVGLFAAVILVPICAIYDYYILWNEHEGSITQFGRLVVHSLVLCLFPWVTGATTALLVQDSMWGRISSSLRKRVLDGVVFGCAWATSVLIIWAINNWWFSVPGFSVPIVVGLAFTAIVGFLLGMFVVNNLRESSSLRRPLAAEMSVRSLAYAQ